MGLLAQTTGMPRQVFRRSKSFLKWLASPVKISRQRADFVANAEKWAVSRVEINGAEVVFSGWAIAVPGLRKKILFHCNGQPVDEVQYPIARPDVADAFPLIPDAHWSGYVCRHRLAEPLPPGGSLEFTCVNYDTRKLIAADYYPYYHRRPKCDDPPIPETARRVRVINQTADDYFRDSGYLQYRRLEWAMQRANGKSFANCQNILDWGCGCGRISRYFRDLPDGRFVGADVDSDNVEWCRKNFNFGRFETLPLRPPCNLSSGSFDCVFGISVFTHLREADQDAWLAELNRITKPGAILLLTVHGDATIYREGKFLKNEYRQIRKHQGIVDVNNNIYDANLPENDYYRETFHTAAYVKSHWGKSFKILEILPGIIGPQDLVVAQRR